MARLTLRAFLAVTVSGIVVDEKLIHSGALATDAVI
jgi:hypothetical protein